jgi:hypothetical protein
VSRQRLLEMRRRFPVLTTLLTLSEGGETSARDRATLMREGPAFVAGSGLGYVVVDTRRCAPDVVKLVEAAFDLEPLGHDGRLTLYRPRATRPH